MGLPAALLVVVLDNVPETMCGIEFYGEEQAFMIYKVSCLIFNCFKGHGFDKFLGYVMFSPLVKGYAGLEDFFRSGHRQEVRFNVTRRQLVARLGLSQLLFLA